MLILLAAALVSAAAAVYFSFMGNPFDERSEKNGTVQGSILSEIPSEVIVAEPEKEPIEDIDSEIEKNIKNEEAEVFAEENKEAENNLTAVYKITDDHSHIGENQG